MEFLINVRYVILQLVMNIKLRSTLTWFIIQMFTTVLSVSSTRLTKMFSEKCNWKYQFEFCDFEAGETEYLERHLHLQHEVSHKRAKHNLVKSRKCSFKRHMGLVHDQNALQCSYWKFHTPHKDVFEKIKIVNILINKV